MGRGSNEFRAAIALPFVLATGLLQAPPSIAQDYPLPDEQPESQTCTVFAGSAADGPREIRARCWGIGVSLGYADGFRAFDNPELRSTVVELEWAGKRRVLLLRPVDDDQPLLEDISGTLANAAGRFSWMGVDELVLDFDQFGTNGRIGIAPGPVAAIDAGQDEASNGSGTSAEPAESTAPSAEPIEVSIGQYIALDEARMATAQPSVTEAN